MWSSSDTSLQRGFSLVEMLVSLLMVAILLVAAGQLVFATRRATQRQTMQVEARQVARGAADYLAFMVRGAADMLVPLSGPRDPWAIMAWWYIPPKGSTPPWPACPDGTANCRQLSFNNVTDATLADEGTDILTVAHANSGLTIPVNWWQGNGKASNNYWDFSDGCPDDAKNLALFEQATGYDPATGMSAPLIGVDDSSHIFWYQITHYQRSICSGGSPCNPSVPCVHVVANPGLSDDVNPPGGQRAGNPTRLLGGVEYVSFRVCQGWLEQKSGLFDPTTDNNCTTSSWNQDPWTPLLPNVEDFQVVWIYDNGNMYDNTSTNQIPSPCTGAVPCQGNPSNALDVTHVLGFRLTVTTHSSASVEIANIGRFFRPAAEDHAAATTADAFYHYQASANAVLRNRAPGL